MFEYILLVGVFLSFVATPGQSCDCSDSCQSTDDYTECVAGIYGCVQSDDAYYPNITEDDENDILWPCIRETVSNSSFNCSCYVDQLSCYISDCGNSSDSNCTGTCYSEYFIDCLIYSDGCYDAWSALTETWFDDSNVSVITPDYIQEWVNDTYCADVDTADNCDGTFWSLWGCFKDCIFDDCAWSQCGDEIQACADNATCYDQLAYVMSLDDLYDQDDEMEDYLISYYCLFETDTGVCSPLLDAAWGCYQSNCAEDSDDCMINQCESDLNACFSDEDCGAVVRQNFYLENICEDDSDNYDEEECDSFGLDDNYSYMQNLCFFDDDYTCDETLTDAFQCYADNCANDTDSDDCDIWGNCGTSTVACLFDYDCYTAFFVNIESWLVYMWLDSDTFLLDWPSEYNDSVAEWCQQNDNVTCNGNFFNMFNCWFDSCWDDSNDTSCAEMYCETEVDDCLDDTSCHKDLEWAASQDECELEDLVDEYCAANDTRCDSTFDTMWECVVTDNECLDCQLDCKLDCDTGDYYDNCTTTTEYYECYSYYDNCYESNGFDNTTDWWDTLICWEEAFNNDSLDCSCWTTYFECNFEYCQSSDNDTDCFGTCITDSYVDCLFESNCRTPLRALFNQSWFNDDDEEEEGLFTPTDISEWVEDYCGGFDNFDTCNSNFYELWSCFDSCWTDECVWGNCLSEIDTCIDNSTSECYEEITWLYEMDDTFGDISDYLGGLVGGYYCNYMVDGGCSSELWSALSCYQDNCDDSDCIGKNCGNYLETCFGNEDCGETAINALAYSNLCDSDSEENTWFNVSACNIYNMHEEYDWIQEMCFFGGFNCNSKLSDVVACNLVECEDDDEHNDWEENENDECNIMSQCTSEVISCWLDKDCYDAFWLNWHGLISAIASESFAVNTPAEYNYTIKEWCDGSDNVTCSFDFWSLWNCFSDSCVFSGCAWDYCTDDIELCAADDTCATDIAYISSIDADSDGALIDAKEDYCAGSTGDCGTLFETAWGCYETNCLNSSSGTGDNETSACEADVTDDCVYYDGTITVKADPGVNIFNFDYNFVIEETCEGHATICIVSQIEDDDTDGDSVTLEVGIGIENEAAYNAISTVVSIFGNALIDKIEEEYNATVTVSLDPETWNTDNAAGCGISISTTTNDAAIHINKYMIGLFIVMSAFIVS